MLQAWSSLLFAACLLLAGGIEARRTVPGAYIVQIDKNFSGFKKRQTASLDQAVTNVVSNMQAKGVKVKGIRQKFDSNLFSGFSIATTDATAAQIAAVQGVVKVWPVSLYDLPEPARGGAFRGKNVTPANLKRSLVDIETRAAANAYYPDNFSPHQMTGVNITHQNGQLGSGILVGIVDSGVDYKNPILGGCFGPGCHVAKGYDFVGNDYNGTNTPMPDADPYTDCNEHGTHVSGIVGALPNSYGFTGVAPEATLAMYRVFGCTGSAGDDVIMAAMMRAANDGCNIISMSLGGPGNFVDGDPLTFLADQLTNAGVPVVAAQGNDGAEGLFDTSSPAANKNGFAVGSIDVLDLPAYPGNVTSGGGNLVNVPYLAAKPLDLSLPITFLSTVPTVTNDACNGTIPAGTNLAGYLTIVRRGTCTFVEKYTNIKAAGGTVAFIYDSPNATVIPYQETFGQEAGMTAVAGLTYNDGVKILNSWNAAQKSRRNKVLWQSSSQSSVIDGVADTDNGGIMSSFSTYGPSTDMYGLPALSAPGGNILSTFPLSMGGVGVISGTSMATPFISGSIAVVMSARKGQNLSPLQIRSLLSSTAKLTSQSTTDSTLRTVVQQGGGLVQLDKALLANTYMSPDHFNLNDTSHRANTQQLTITNRNTQSVTYNLGFTNTNAVAVYSGGNTDILPNPDPVLTYQIKTIVQFSQNSVTLGPGQSAQITCSFSSPRTAPGVAANFPVYGGYVTVSGESGLTYHIPYNGLLGNTFDFPTIDDTNYANGTPYPRITDSSGNPVAADAVATFSLSGGGTTLQTRVAMGTPQANVDLILASTPFTPTTTTGGDQLRKRAPLERRAARALYSDTPTVGNIASESDLPRDQLFADTTKGYTETDYTFDGTYSTASGATATVTPGTQYKILVRSLRNTGDPTYEDQWDSWLSPAFTFTN